MSEKLVLIDGYSILNRAFFGIPDLSNSEGLHTNAVYGFLNILFRILEEEQPDYLTVAFDVSAPTFRHEMYAEYKGTRKPMAPELREQVPVMKEMLKAMGVTIVEKAGYEADDLLGTIAKRCEDAGKSATPIIRRQKNRHVRLLNWGADVFMKMMLCVLTMLFLNSSLYRFLSDFKPVHQPL